ncbi:unnamed protein product, partial [Vitis vinifera]
MSLSTSKIPALSTYFNRSSRAVSSSPNRVIGCFRNLSRRMTSCFGRTISSIFYGVEVAEAAAAVEEDAVPLLWRRALASNSRFSCSRSFWMFLCSISERLKNLLPPASWARDWRFFKSSCFRRSI